jgi:hypothetical protein
MQLAKGRYCRPLVIWAPADNGLFLRVGMSILIEQYPHLDILTPAESHFVWFMSAADKGVLSTQFGMSAPPTLGGVLLDCAIVLSLNAGLEGRIGLHAAPAGGRALLQFYLKSGLLNLPLAAALPRPIKRRNDGRHFYTDAPAAQRLLQQVDPSR